MPDGIKVVVGGSAKPNWNAPRLHDLGDWTPDGTLVAAHLGHPNNPLTAVPSSGAAVYNHAWKEAARLIGSGDATSLSLTMDIGSAFTPTYGKLELSARKGLHVMMSPTQTGGTGRYAALRFKQPIASYLLENKTHRFYLSSWWRTTRFGTQTSNAVSGISMNASPSLGSNLLAAIIAPSNTTAANKTNFRLTRTLWTTTEDPTLAFPYTEPIFGNVAVNGYQGTPDISGSALLSQMKMFGCGTANPFSSTGGGMSSRIFYAGLLVDLDVAGLSYAEMDAIDYAAYQAAVTTPGGLYHAGSGESWNPPDVAAFAPAS